MGSEIIARLVLLCYCLLLAAVAIRLLSRNVSLQQKGIIGYVLLVIHASFLHTPIIGLLALPIFAASIVVCAILLLFLPLCNDQVSKKRWFGTFLIIMGITGLSATVACAAIQYGDYLVASSRNVVDRFFPAPWQNILKILAFDIITSGLTVLGVRQRSKWKGRKTFLLWLVLFLAVPLTIVLIKLWEILGFPLSA